MSVPALQKSSMLAQAYNPSIHEAEAGRTRVQSHLHVCVCIYKCTHTHKHTHTCIERDKDIVSSRPKGKRR